MESRWAQLGFVGFILLAVYGLAYLTLISLPETLLGAQVASGSAFVLGCLGGFAGILSALSFVAYFSELRSRYAAFAVVIGVIAWAQQSEAHLVSALGFIDLGTAEYSVAILWLMLTYAVWGVVLFSARRKLGSRQRCASFAAVLFLINGLAWIGYLGVAVLVVASLLQALVLTPPVEFFGFVSPIHFFTPKRQYQIGQLGLAFLTLYFVVAVRWLVNGVFPLPLVVVTPLNLLALLSVWLGVLGIGIVFDRFENQFGDPMFGYASAVSIAGLLLLSLADFTWLMSNISVLAEPLWGLIQYWNAPFFWLWSDLPLCLSSLLSGAAFVQEFRRSKRKSYPEIPILAVIFIASAVAWLYGLGYLLLIVAGPLILRLFMRYKLGGSAAEQVPSFRKTQRRARRISKG